MILLLPLLSATLATRYGAAFLARRGVNHARAWASWPEAAAAGMGMVFVSTGITHFIEPRRSGLEAIVPAALPRPDIAVTASGLAEFALAVGLIVPTTRRPAAIASILMLSALFPANIVAAQGVDHPAAPSTPLIPRILLQAVFMAFAGALLLRRESEARSLRSSAGE